MRHMFAVWSSPTVTSPFVAELAALLGDAVLRGMLCLLDSGFASTSGRRGSEPKAAAAAAAAAATRALLDCSMRCDWLPSLSATVRCACCVLRAAHSALDRELPREELLLGG